MVYFQGIHVLLLSVYTDFLQWNYCLRQLNYTQPHSAHRTLLSMYELVYKTDCAEDLLIFFHPSPVSAATPSPADLFASDVSMSV
jgi:hypothetical protein